VITLIKMADLTRQEPLANLNENDTIDVVKLLTFLSNKGFTTQNNYKEYSSQHDIYLYQSRYGIL
jgi:hypothetical protein